MKDRKRMKDDNTVKWIGEKVNNLEVLKKRIIIKLAIQDVMVDFLVDTGATSTLINAKTYALLGSPRLENCTTTLVGYGNQEIPVLGKTVLQTSYKG